MRVNMTVFGMCIVDAYKAFSGCKGERCTITQDEFYAQLAEELIDNSLDSMNLPRRAPTTQQSSAMANGVAKSGVGAHLMLTKRRRKSKDENVQRARLQGRCRVCDLKTTQVCSVCRKHNRNEPDTWLCSTRKGATCFPTHIAGSHNV